MTRTALLLLFGGVLGCTEYRPRGFEQPMSLGGKEVPASVLTEGARAYALYCRSCHGEQGDGKGPSALGMRPPPRDFTLGQFKFAAVPGGTLPRDEDLERIVRGGLHGTAMLAWDGIPAHEVQAIIQYVKTFSSRWEEEEPGEAIVASPDPWKGGGAEAVERGKKLYHGLAQCNACHPSFASKAYIHEASKELTGRGITDFREDMYGSLLTDSDYGVKILPPDFTRHLLRSIRPGHRVDDLYRVVAAGVGGTAMPTWHGSLPDEDLWALVHYVDSLVELRGTGEPWRLLQANRAEDARWKPPARD